jgi:hypothetical protein
VVYQTKARLSSPYLTPVPDWGTKFATPTRFDDAARHFEMAERYPQAAITTFQAQLERRGAGSVVEKGSPLLAL